MQRQQQTVQQHMASLSEQDHQKFNQLSFVENYHYLAQHNLLEHDAESESEFSVSDSESEDSEATLSNEYESDDDFSCEKFRIRKPSVNINIDNLNINRMRSALADLVGSDENQIDRIFLEKTVENGEEIKVIITDEYLKNVALSEKVHV